MSSDLGVSMGIIKRLRERNAARAAYFAADKQAGALNDQLAQAADPWQRGKLLRKLADLEMDQCRRHHTAFGRDVDDDGIDMADSLRYSSMLYRALADVEHVVACNGRVGRNWRIRELGEDADEVLDRMATAKSLAWRMVMLRTLYDAVVDKVGGQAAEVLACLPAPGHSGWSLVKASRR